MSFSFALEIIFKYFTNTPNHQWWLTFQSSDSSYNHWITDYDYMFDITHAQWLDSFMTFVDQVGPAICHFNSPFANKSHGPDSQNPLKELDHVWTVLSFSFSLFIPHFPSSWFLALLSGANCDNLHRPPLINNTNFFFLILNLYCGSLLNLIASRMLHS